MRTPLVLLAAALSIAAVVPLRRAVPAPGTVDDTPGRRRAVEVARIRAHFDSVLHELPARDVSRLDAPRRERREALLRTLRAYRDRGVFPHNYDFPGAAVPYFVDRVTGTRCAVAHLMESTGRGDLVQRVASTDNNVLVAELAGDTAVLSWLDAHGLTLAEAARIQVPYVGDDSPIVASVGSRNAVYAVGTGVVVGGSLLTSLWNARGNSDGHSRLASVAGFATGALTLGFGAASLRDPGAPAVVAPLSLVAGGLSTYLSTRGFLRHRRLLTTGARTEQGRRQPARAAVAPLLPLGGGGGGGVAVRVTF